MGSQTDRKEEILMTMAFDSWAAFFVMGGYAFYVWLAVGVTSGSLIALWFYTLWQHKQLLASIQRRKARRKRLYPLQESAPDPLQNALERNKCNK